MSAGPLSREAIDAGTPRRRAPASAAATAQGYAGLRWFHASSRLAIA